MDPLTLGLIFGGGSLLQRALFGKPAEDRARQLAATETRYSPWTGIKGQVPQEGNPMGAALQGGVAGASMGQNIQQGQQMNELQKAQSAYLTAQTQAKQGVPDLGGVVNQPGVPQMPQMAGQAAPPQQPQQQPQGRGWSPYGATMGNIF